MIDTTPAAVAEALARDDLRLPLQGSINAFLVNTGERLMPVWGDVVHVAALQLWDPRASVKYASSDADAQRTRAALFGRAAGGHLWIAAAHLAFPGLGHLRRSAGRPGGRYDRIPAIDEADPGHP